MAKRGPGRQVALYEYHALCQHFGFCDGNVLSLTSHFLVIGAYPPTGTYDECTTVEDRPRALKPFRRSHCHARTPSTGSAVRCRNSGKNRGDRIRRPLPYRRHLGTCVCGAGGHPASEKLRRSVRSRAFRCARDGPSRAVMTGDTPYDAKATRAAGVSALGVLTGGFF
jgi:hypothetical protein